MPVGFSPPDMLPTSFGVIVVRDYNRLYNPGRTPPSGQLAGVSQQYLASIGKDDRQTFPIKLGTCVPRQERGRLDKLVVCEGPIVIVPVKSDSTSPQ